VSAWVKWKIASTALMLGVFLALAGFGEAVNEVFAHELGQNLHLGHLISVVWLDLFRMNRLKERFDAGDLPSWRQWIALLAVLAILLNGCSIAKLKAREVVPIVARQQQSRDRLRKRLQVLRRGFGSEPGQLENPAGVPVWWGRTVPADNADEPNDRPRSSY